MPKIGTLWGLKFRVTKNSPWLPSCQMDMKTRKEARLAAKDFEKINGFKYVAAPMSEINNL